MEPTLFDYDLNVYRQEQIVGLDADSFNIYDYVDPWYIDVYQVNEYQGATTHDHIAGPIQLTAEEADMLELGYHYFNENDNWYGMDGFLRDYSEKIHPRILGLLDTLPKYVEEVLF